MDLSLDFGLIPMAIGEHLFPEVFSVSPPTTRPAPGLPVWRRLDPSRNPAPIPFPAAPVTVSIGFSPVEHGAICRW